MHKAKAFARLAPTSGFSPEKLTYAAITDVDVSHHASYTIWVIMPLTTVTVLAAVTVPETPATPLT